jgi:hypothetical protein
LLQNSEYSGKVTVTGNSRENCETEFYCQDWEHCTTYAVLEKILMALVNAHVDTGKSDSFSPLTQQRQLN